MNRATALLLAMAALLAHTLTIHLDFARHFAPPYEFAHVAFRIARNFIREGHFAWNVRPLEGSLGSYPSPLWVLVAALSERLYLPPTLFCQLAGLVATLGTVALSSNFATNRFAGVVPPMLLVLSGSTAAAAASGTETAFLTLFLTGTFVAYEHRWRGTFSVALAGLVATRPEGVVIALAFGALTALEHHVPRRDRARPLSAFGFLPAAAIVLLLASVRRGDGSSLYLATLAALVTPKAAQLRNGLAYVRDFVVSSATPLLLVFPACAILARRISGVGLRALALALLWAWIIAVEGGGPQPFSEAMAPALPLTFIAIQQGLLFLLDLGRRPVERLCWVLLVGGAGLSALGSKFPGDLGPIPLYPLHRAWMNAHARPPFGIPARLGRESLDDEIRLTGELRDLGVYLRDHVPTDRSLLTPWPGAVGYLSGLRVLDMFGRTTTPPGMEPPVSWTPPTGTDLVALLDQRPDFVLPALISAPQLADPEFPEAFLRAFASLDTHPTPERVDEILSQLADYDWVTLLVPFDEGRGADGRARPFPLLERGDIGTAPTLELSRDDDAVRIEARYGSSDPGALQALPPILARLRLTCVDDRGRSAYVTPEARLSGDARVCVRDGLLLVPGAAPTRLADVVLPAPPEAERWTLVRAELLNPGMRARAAAALIGNATDLGE